MIPGRIASRTGIADPGYNKKNDCRAPTSKA